MSIDTIFTANEEHLRHLNPIAATDLFRELLRTEALRLPPGSCKINVPRQIYANDGGIDGTVDADPLVTQSDIIAPCNNGYQIKSGKTFKPWLQKEIKKEFFGDRRPLNRENLGENIRACLESKGTYVLVCTGINLSKSRTEKTRAYIEKYLKQECEFENPKVKVWSQDDLIHFLDEFPLLVLGLKGLLEAKLKPHWRWSGVNSMQVPFVSGQSQEKLIEKIQNELRRSDQAVYVPVWGDPGVGKTRLVLEATKTDDLSPLVIYCDSASQFESSVLMDAICSDNNLSAIVVIDGCEPRNQIRIWDELKGQGPRIKLVTISNNYDKIPEEVSECQVLRLDDEQIIEIIQHHEIPKPQADRHAYLCSGSPLMANHVGKVLAHSSGDASEVLSQDTIYQNFYIDFPKEHPSNPEVQQRELVLQHIALFKQFGFKGEVACEARTIAKKVEDAAGSQIKPPMFRKIVKDLQKRGILKGVHTLNITPIAFHIKLWVDCWETYYDDEFNLEEFTQDLTPELVEWFYEMFRYAAESEAASILVKEFLGPDGPFGDGEYLKTELGSRFFLALTEADPKSALRCLESTIGTWDRETLLHFTEGRRNVIWALEKIAVWRELFTGAAQLLLALGEAENEICSNNASATFAGLFSPGTRKVAPTEASPAKRLPVLVEAFESDSKERRALALRACNAALESTRFLRMGSAEYQGLRPEAELWTPKTYGELWDAYRQVWQLLSQQLEYLPEDEREGAVSILIGRVRELERILDLRDMIVETVETIVQKRYANEKQLIEAISKILYYDESYGDNGLSAETRQRLEQLKDELVGSDFHSLLQRYVGLALLEDKFDADGKPANPVQSHLETLAQQAVENHHRLQSELRWLVTVEAKKGYHFGYELGKRDDGFSLLPTLLDTQRNAGENASVSFLGGYFRSIFESDVPLWEEQINALVDDTTLNIAIPELTHCSGLTDRAGLRLLNLATNGIIGINHFRIFGYGRATESLSDQVFTKWTQFLMDTADKSAMSTALRLYYHYYIRRKPQPTLPHDLTFQLLTHPFLFEASNVREFDDMDEHNWTEIGKAFLHLYPEQSLELVVPILSHFGEEGTIVGFDSQVCSLLDEITEQYPAQMWEHVSKLLEDQTHFSRTDTLEQWLKSGNPWVGEEEGTLTLIPPEKIWEWIDEDVEERAWYFARNLVPKTLSTEEWPTSLAREVLMRYGERDDVRVCLSSNYLTEGWSGPASLRYENKQRMLLDIKDGEDNENVKQWIDEFVEGLKEITKQAEIDEERRF